MYKVQPTAMLNEEVGLRIRRRRLPHWEFPSSIYFVTFRLADSLPQSVLLEMKAKCKEIRSGATKASKSLSPEQRSRLARLFWKTVERHLDAGSGDCQLREGPCAGIMADALRHFNGTRYALWAWCIMPNHVHVVFQPLGSQTIERIVHSWKSFSANEINRIAGRRGRLWMREYYDHMIRNEKELDATIRYVVRNPVKARLPNWPWVYPQL